VARELGPWGKTKLRTYFHRIEDIIDIIPLSNRGQGIGNLPLATRIGAESTSTINFDPVGWKGAKLDLTLALERTRVRDPLTAERRPISGTRNRRVSASFRHDVPGTDLAWGTSASYQHYNRYYYLSEVFRSWEGPWFVNAFIEHKDVSGVTVRATAGNIFNARHRLTRTVYAGWRDADPVAFVQKNNQLIGPIFSLSIRGNF
jgi:hypothetical protein